MILIDYIYRDVKDSFKTESLGEFGTSGDIYSYIEHTYNLPLSLNDSTQTFGANTVPTIEMAILECAYSHINPGSNAIYGDIEVGRRSNPEKTIQEKAKNLGFSSS